jgi:mono/diheme cytochrome c family protein
VVLLALAAMSIISGCRQDMQNQPKFIPLRSNTFYPDQRSARYPVPGTVPRLDNAAWDDAQLDPNSYYLTGKHGNAFGNELPYPLTREVLAHGEDRYNIYCAPCHARIGDGNGMIVQRGFKHPPTFHQQRLRNAPVGYFYDIMSNGLGAMPDYSTQLKPADRWAVAAYIRALQLSQNATENDVAAADKEKLKAPSENGIKIPSSSTTSPTAMQPQGGVKP